MSNTCCEMEDYVCDRCHSLGMITALCLSSGSRDPMEVINALMHLPEIHMHGPEQHVLMGSALLTAYRNVGDDIDLE